MKTISLPRSPFFCTEDGRYLPSLTGLIVEAAAMLQRIEIEEQLFKLHLKQKFFQALADRAPQSVFQQGGLERDQHESHKLIEVGSTPTPATLAAGESPGGPQPARPGAKASIRIFPGSLAEHLKMKGDW